jgi:DNA primase catalytic core
MALIPESEILKLKNDISLQSVVESYGINLESKGKDLIGLCPFHNDQDPSLVISTDNNLWNCLGACQEGGDIISWIQKKENLNFREAFYFLKDKYSNTPLLFNPEQDKQQMLNQYILFCNQNLKNSPEALNYLKKRNLHNSQIIDHFKLGFSNQTLNKNLPPYSDPKGVLIRAKLKESGVLRKTGHEHFSGSLIIPIFDSENNVVEIYGRKIRDNLRAGTQLHNYLPGPHSGVFNLSSLAAFKEIILCESLIDALTFWSFGFTNVTTSYGINGFTQDHINAFKELKIEKIMIAYDRDEGGNKASFKLSEQLIKEGFDIYRIKFPFGQDVKVLYN